MTITRPKLKEYIWCGGDDDGYSRSGRPGSILDEEWALIRETETAIGIIQSGFAADSFKRNHAERVKQVFDCEETYKILVEYVAKSKPLT